jgi:hypothetical protein
MLVNEGVRSRAQIVGDLALNTYDIESLSGMEREELQTKVIPIRMLK